MQRLKFTLLKTLENFVNEKTMAYSMAFEVELTLQIKKKLEGDLLK
jgi:hypothetical protein